MDGKQQEGGGRVTAPQTRLWFAGEAATRNGNDAYTVHGAFESGAWGSCCGMLPSPACPVAGGG